MRHLLVDFMICYISRSRVFLSVRFSCQKQVTIFMEFRLLSDGCSCAPETLHFFLFFYTCPFRASILRNRNLCLSGFSVGALHLLNVFSSVKVPVWYLLAPNPLRSAHISLSEVHKEPEHCGVETPPPPSVSVVELQSDAAAVTDSCSSAVV